MLFGTLPIVKRIPQFLKKGDLFIRPLSLSLSLSLFLSLSINTNWLQLLWLYYHGHELHSKFFFFFVQTIQIYPPLVAGRSQRKRSIYLLTLIFPNSTYRCLSIVWIKCFYFCGFFTFFDGNWTKKVFSVKKMILTSKWHAEHPFAG